MSTLDTLPLSGLDHIEFYVGNARQAAHFYRSALGMELMAYQGPETGIHDRASYVLTQGSVRFVLTAARRPNHPIADQVYRSGGCVRGITFRVEDAKEALCDIKRRGGRIVQEPMEFRDEYGLVRTFAVAGYGDTVHTLLERRDYGGVFLPGFSPVSGPDLMAYAAGFDRVSRITIITPPGEPAELTAFYEKVLGFARHDGGELVKRTACGGELRVVVRERGDGPALIPPAGVVEIALSTEDLASTVSRMKSHGVEFNDCFDTTRRGEICAAIKPAEDHPSLSFAIVERTGLR